MFCGTGEKRYLFQRNKGQMLRGTGEQRQNWGTGNIRKQIFDFGGTWEQANLFLGNMQNEMSSLGRRGDWVLDTLATCCLPQYLGQAQQ